MNLELLKQVLIVGISASIFSTAIIQKIKEQLKSKKWLFFISLIISIGIGIFFTLTFAELDIIGAFWVGISAWLGSDTIYRAFEDKIFKKFSDINNITEIKREDEE